MGIKWPPVDIHSFDSTILVTYYRQKTLAFVERRIIPIFYEKSSKNGHSIQVIL